MKVRTDITTRCSYSLLFPLAILWTKEKTVQTFSVLTGDTKTPVTVHTPYQGEELLRGGSRSIPTPGRNTQLWHSPTSTPGVAPSVWPEGHRWHCQHPSLLCTTARTGQRPGHSPAKDKESQRSPGQKALKRLTEKKTVLIKHEVI